MVCRIVGAGNKVQYVKVRILQLTVLKKHICKCRTVIIRRKYVGGGGWEEVGVVLWVEEVGVVLWVEGWVW